jgi:hypothetical protein
MKSISAGRVVEVLTANEFNGVKLVGGDATFRKALSAACIVSCISWSNLSIEFAKVMKGIC